MGTMHFIDIQKDPAGTNSWAITVERKTNLRERLLKKKDSTEMYIGRRTFRNARTGELAGQWLATWLGEIVWKHERRIKLERLKEEKERDGK